MSVASSEGSVSHDGVSEEEERAQPYTVPVGQTESVSFQKKRQNLDWGMATIQIIPSLLLWGW